jgi:predicted phosphodiesterase
VIGLISDVHGNAAALGAVLAELDALGVEEVLCLGDVAGYGPQVNECCDMLRRREIPTLIGNHDDYLAFDKPCPRSAAANICLDYQRRIIEPGHKTWLGENPRYRDLPPDIRMVHAGWDDPLEEYLYRLKRSYFERLSGARFFAGHTHVQGVWQMGDKSYCNPGSVGQPRDGDARAAFAVIDGPGVTLHRVGYDIDEVADAARTAGYEDRLFMNLYDGARIGGQISTVSVVRDDPIPD